MDGNKPFLSTLNPGPGDRRAASLVFIASLAVFVAAAPFAKLPLPEVPAFLPLYQSAFVIIEVITAVLLFGQFNILRSRALLVLASGYVFSAAMAVFHALSFPGLFAPAGLLGAGSQSTAWIYFLWHGGFPLFVIGYTLLKDGGHEPMPSSHHVSSTALLYAAAAVVLASGLTLLATAGQDSLPPIMAGNLDAPAKVVLATAVWALSLVALAILWRQRPHSVLDVWLMVVLCVWIFDSALAAVLNHGRYDLGWYAGRIYGLLAGSFVLLVLLLENGKLYARLADSHEKEVSKSAELQRLSVQLESVNRQLAERNRQLDEASRLKSEFLANMSHELRTPLNAIIGFSEVLKDGLLGEMPPNQHECVGDIFGSGQHLLSLINDILDLSKVEAGKMTLDLERLDVDAMLGNSLSIVREKAAARQIQLRLDTAAPLGTVLLDARKTKQIVFNLLSNAVKFTPERGCVTLRARKVGISEVEAWAAPETTSLRLPLAPGIFAEFLEIEVEDTGIGVLPEDAPRLFRVFSQLDSSLSRKTEGTGLGLALVHKLAQLHGGTVALASTPGHGSRFLVWLPWREANPDLDDTKAMQRQPSAPPARPVALVIEDNDRAAELVRLQLEPEGLEVVRAATAREGLGLLAQREPAVIILDIMLPDMDGWELLARIKQPGSRSARIPVVIASIVADAQKGFSLGASAVLQKPVSHDDLVTALEDLGLARSPGSIKVLVVDDDPKAVELLAAYLAEPGYDVLRAYGGREGIAAARSERPDLLVLDLMMPDVNGFDVVQELKGSSETAAIPIVVVTAKSLTAEDHASLNGYVAAILEKASFNHGHFVREVRRALTLRQ